MIHALPKVSVIIPARNAANTIEDCLRALLTQHWSGPPLEIIVVDDGSTDDTIARVRRFTVNLLTQAHLGPAAARNRGAIAAHGELLLFTDADCAPAPDWAEKLAGAFSDPRVVGAKGIYRTHQREVIARLIQIEYEEKYARLARRSSIDFIDTYCAVYRREVFLRQGGFDEGFPSASVEDQELSFRLAAEGMKMVFVPDAVVYHAHPKTLRAYARRKFWIGYWKVRVGTRHPSKMVSDTHTPPNLKLQVACAGLAAIAGVAGFVNPLAWLVMTAAVLTFVLSTRSLIDLIHQRAPELERWAFLFIVVRAFSLGIGLVAGIFGEIARSEKLKRALDIVGASLALLLFAPAMVLAALAIALESRGSLLFVQTRAGKDGRPFRLLKFRTMVPHAEEQLPRVMLQSIVPPPIVKIPHDPRVTPVGRVLRRTSLDELPQLFNVLRGDMSLVGPRPEELRVVAQYNDWQRRRLTVKPGLTGPMQINGRGLLPLDERVALELAYIENYSLLEDLRILVQTIPAVLTGRGSY